jgi:hypothetical protein
MATTYKRLGAIASTGTIGTGDILYQVPASTAAVISTISICNTAATAATYRISISLTTSFVTAGYLAYNATVAANETVFVTCGLTVDAINKYLLCSASAATVVFSVFGSEIS